jgi:hypothetical protein
VVTELTVSELQAIRRQVELIGRLSDGLVRVGPLRLGIDGVLAWLPGVGELYSAGAGAYIIAQGVRARVPVSTLASCAALMLGRTTITAIPLAGPLAADLLTAHRWSARLMLKAIDARLAALGAPVRPARRGFGRLWSGRRPTASPA